MRLKTKNDHSSLTKTNDGLNCNFSYVNLHTKCVLIWFKWFLNNIAPELRASDQSNIFASLSWAKEKKDAQIEMKNCIDTNKGLRWNMSTFFWCILSTWICILREHDPDLKNGNPSLWSRYFWCVLYKGYDTKAVHRVFHKPYYSFWMNFFFHSFLPKTVSVYCRSIRFEFVCFHYQLFVVMHLCHPESYYKLFMHGACFIRRNLNVSYKAAHI